MVVCQLQAAPQQIGGFGSLFSSLADQARGAAVFLEEGSGVGADVMSQFQQLFVDMAANSTVRTPDLPKLAGDTGSAIGSVSGSVDSGLRSVRNQVSSGAAATTTTNLGFGSLADFFRGGADILENNAPRLQDVVTRVNNAMG